MRAFLDVRVIFRKIPMTTSCPKFCITAAANPTTQTDFPFFPIHSKTR